MYIRIGKVRIHIGFPFAVFCAFAANSSLGTSAVIYFTSALLHECGHAAALICCGEKLVTLYLSLGGARICSRGLAALSYKHDAAVAFAGPAVNLVLSAALFVLFRLTDGEALGRAAEANFVLGGVNLLPVPFLDGGRLLSDTLNVKRSERRAETVCDVCGAAVFFLLSVLFVVLTAKGENTLFLGIFLIYCILQKTFGRHLK